VKIDWSGPLTKGRPAYTRVLGCNQLIGLNYTNGFYFGWDRWSDDNPDMSGIPWGAFE
jgi:hypothetical protein